MKAKKKQVKAKSWSERWLQENAAEAATYAGTYVLLHPVLGIVMFAKNPTLLNERAKVLIKKTVNDVCVQVYAGDAPTNDPLDFIDRYVDVFDPEVS